VGDFVLYASFVLAAITWLLSAATLILARKGR